MSAGSFLYLRSWSIIFLRTLFFFFFSSFFFHRCGRGSLQARGHSKNGRKWKRKRRVTQMRQKWRKRIEQNRTLPFPFHATVARLYYIVYKFIYVCMYTLWCLYLCDRMTASGLLARECEKKNKTINIKNKHENII